MGNDKVPYIDISINQIIILPLLHSNGILTTRLKDEYETGDKYIHTTDWGSFKRRKNGRITFMCNGEVIRCQTRE